MIEHTSLSDLTGSQTRVLRSLTIDSDSMMRDILDLNTDADIWIFFLYGKVVGWACVDCEEEHPVLNVFVHPEHRRKGIGSALCSRALETFPDCEVRPWDRKGSNFYAKFAVHINTNYL